MARRTIRDFKRLAADRGISWIGPRLPTTIRQRTRWRLANGDVLVASFMDVRDIGIDQEACNSQHQVGPTDFARLAVANEVVWLGPDVFDKQEHVAWRCPRCDHPWTENYHFMDLWTDHHGGCPFCIILGIIVADEA